ncbi:fused DSP-PTPase phosphatase/NAD kinase-like protein [Lichenibacterium dinghuense]|uniref:fused DSP-PTPase phosphatase/NAD kinase-like protein n=1 Tax=Lichenibacterium dinghuense TaxID=2895977 RepID=UPI001F274227|nr:tyrosine-protein phosphatase [Lichenibacterium sp. 6Y81]
MSGRVPHDLPMREADVDVRAWKEPDRGPVDAHPRRSRTGLAGAMAVVLSVGLAAGGWAGWLRLSGNIHEFDGGMYRSGQLGPERLSSFVREHGIRTVLNLRGENPGKGWYDAEIGAVSEAGATLVSIQLSAAHEPDAVTMARLIEVLRTSPRPLLLHCDAGADRSGLASALYELAVMHRAPATADRQLSFRYGHFPWLTSKSGAMDRAFAAYSAAFEAAGG